MSQQVINFSFTVQPAVAPPPALVVVDGAGNPLADGASVTLKDQTVGVADPGQVLFTVSGGVAPYSFKVTDGAVPDGDSLGANTNDDESVTVDLAGTPTTAGPASFAVTVSDSAGNSTTVAAKSA